MSQFSLDVVLQNCYGIGSLATSFDFSNSRATVVYAPNGAMKTSFAKTFIDIAEGRESGDRIFPDREVKREVRFGDEGEISPDDIVVIEPFNANFESRSISKLLVNESLRKEYDSIYDVIGRKLDNLLSLLSKASGIKKEVLADKFVADTTISKTDIYTALARLERQVKDLSEPTFEVRYSEVLNPKIAELIEQDDIKEKIDLYAEKYDELLKKSRFFRAGKFNHYNASTIAKILKDNGWFAGGHTVTLRDASSFVEIDNEKDLERLIQEEMDAILNDVELKKTFTELDKLLNKNAELRGYREFLSENNAIIAELSDVSSFKERLWISYLCSAKTEYLDLIQEYDAARKELERIRTVARDEASRWHEVISIFNERFSVPFRVYVDNQEDVILQSVAPSLEFSYFDAQSNSEKSVTTDVLDGTLSQGERRAKYLLNVIFEMEGRRSDSKAIFIIDDIADSFDYKNKYAIIEYLKDISEHATFFQIILTHNYDFFRTVVSRLELYQPNRLHAVKNGGNIVVQPTPKEQNPFINWKKNLDRRENVVACVPFIRNIAEYCGYDGCYLRLTSALHWKEETKTITLKDIEAAFSEVIGDGSARIPNNEVNYLNVLFDCCDELSRESIEEFSLEKKIVLSIGTRLLAERYMVKKIADDAWVNNLKSSQTGKLSKKYFEICGGDVDESSAFRVIRKVNLITPENIHVNSFMYEPILDISPATLRDLYLEAKSVF
ncbi:phage infection protein [Pelagibacterium halotolerans]|uniref:phage infection protein n=1 Tax=Pelagibacterium halotolerans TaxID=531813 RepID=UPI00385157C5